MSKIPRVSDLLPVARIGEEILLQNAYGDRNFLVGPDKIVKEIKQDVATRFWCRAREEGTQLWSEEQTSTRYERWGREGRPVHPFLKLPRNLDRNWAWWYDEIGPEQAAKPKAAAKGKKQSKAKPKPPPVPKEAKKKAATDRDWRRELREKLGLDPDGD